MERRTKRRFVRIVCCAAAALLLVLSLLTEIRTNALRDELAALRCEEAELGGEIRILDVRLAMRLPLGEVERLAEERLGMRSCRPDQRVPLTLGE